MKLSLKIKIYNTRTDRLPIDVPRSKYRIYLVVRTVKQGRLRAHTLLGRYINLTSAQRHLNDITLQIMEQNHVTSTR